LDLGHKTKVKNLGKESRFPFEYSCSWYVTLSSVLWIDYYIRTFMELCCVLWKWCTFKS